MAEKRLQDLKKSYKREEVLLPLVERHVLKQAHSTDNGRRNDIMHPSEMSDYRWCGRHDFYRITKVEPSHAHKDTTRSFRLSNVLANGNDIHDRWQGWLNDMGILWGRWECRECTDSWFGYSPVECLNCGSVAIKYREVPFDAPDLMIAGHADGIVKVGDENVLLEIKSVGMGTIRYSSYPLWEQAMSEQMTPEEVWFQIKRPFGSHLRQATIYLHLTKLLYPELGVDRAVFLYEWKPTQEVKEFVIQYNPVVISKTLETATIVRESVDSGELPDRPDWASENDKGCKTCEYRGTCWGKPREESAPSGPAVRVKRAPAAQRRRAVRS